MILSKVDIARSSPLERAWSDDWVIDLFIALLVRGISLLHSMSIQQISACCTFPKCITFFVFWL